MSNPFRIPGPSHAERLAAIRAVSDGIREDRDRLEADQRHNVSNLMQLHQVVNTGIQIAEDLSKRLENDKSDLFNELDVLFSRRDLYHHLGRAYALSQAISSAITSTTSALESADRDLENADAEENELLDQQEFDRALEHTIRMAR